MVGLHLGVETLTQLLVLLAVRRTLVPKHFLLCAHLRIPNPRPHPLEQRDKH